MTDALYLDDSYMKEFDAQVVSVKEDRFVVLDQTAFYPNMGGQPNDTGKIVRLSDKAEFPVVFVGKFDGEISHEVSVPGLKPGDKVKGIIDWDRRYTHMRYHTAAHVLARTIHDETGAFTSGNQLGPDKSRIDFTLDEFDKDKMQECIEKANQTIVRALPVEIGEMSYSDAESDDEFSKPSKYLMPKIDRLRVVDIKGFDKQACGGTHLKNISEIGKLEFVKAENKGKNNRRLYFRLCG